MNNNKLKVYEDESEFIELSENDMEFLTCKQVFKPLHHEYSIFIFENFDKRYFKNEGLQTLFKVAKNFWSKYENYVSEEMFLKIIDNQKLKSEKDEYLNLYHQVINFKEEEYDEKYVKDSLVKFTKMRAMYFAILDNVDDIEKRQEIGDVMGRFEKIAQLDMLNDIGIEYFSNLENHCEKLISIESRLEFGFKELDRMTYGGLPTSDTCLFIIMAQPGLGKSQIMMNIAYNWVMKGKNVLMISLEMSEEMYSRRFDGLFSDLNINKLKENVGLLRLKINQIRNDLPNTQLRIKEFPTGTCSTAMIKNYLKKLKLKGFEPDLICVDYLNIMKPNGYSSNMGLYEKGARIAEELRALSSELKKPVISAIQANRGAAGGYAGSDIDIGNSAESAGIPATADAMVALFQLEGEREQGVINLKILKNRLGGYVGNIIKLGVNYETLKINNFDGNDEMNDEIDSFVDSKVNNINNDEHNSIEDI